MTYIVPIS